MNRNKERDANGLVEEPGGKVRLFVEAAARVHGAKVALTDAQAHYLLRVMRAGDGRPRCSSSTARTANGAPKSSRRRSARRRSCAKRRRCRRPTCPICGSLFAPIKKTPADYVAQKATELGVRVLQPVLTHRTIARRVNTDRLAGQCDRSRRAVGPRERARDPRAGRLSRRCSRSWPKDRRLVFCDEARRRRADRRRPRERERRGARMGRAHRARRRLRSGGTRARARQRLRRSGDAWARASCAPTPQRLPRSRCGRPSSAIGGAACKSSRRISRFRAVVSTAPMNIAGRGSADVHPAICRRPDSTRGTISSLISRRAAKPQERLAHRHRARKIRLLAEGL